jgi:hypothetical protein
MAVQVRARPVGWPGRALMQTRFHSGGAIAGAYADSDHTGHTVARSFTRVPASNFALRTP